MVQRCSNKGRFARMCPNWFKEALGTIYLDSRTTTKNWMQGAAHYFLWMQPQEGQLSKTNQTEHTTPCRQEWKSASDHRCTRAGLKLVVSSASPNMKASFGPRMLPKPHRRGRPIYTRKIYDKKTQRALTRGLWQKRVVWRHQWCPM